MAGKRPFTQHCAHPGCKNTWKSRKAQEGAVLYCTMHQILLKKRNGQSNWDDLQTQIAPETLEGAE